MFRLSYSSPQKEKLTIKVKKKPDRLGPFTDGYGNWFDCKGYGMNNNGWWAWLCPYSDLHPSYSDTSGKTYGWASQQWRAYELEIVNEESV